MSNSYFRFKRFSIDQEHCAMKVTTDACIQGAWTPVRSSVSRVLDIGAGTGLLSLMLAQRASAARVDAIELDEDAVKQAATNIAASPWQGRVSVLHGDVRDYPFTAAYDLIISNPPFFNNSLLGDKRARNNARHTLSLTHADLLTSIDDNLSPNGYASVLLPYTEYVGWQKLLLRNGWMELDRLFVRHTPGAVVKRVVCLFGRDTATSPLQSELIIKDDNGLYTSAFTALLADYYLDL